MAIFKKHITQMAAYSPPLEGRDPAKHLLLDFNECTLPISTAVQKALIDYIQSGRLQMYPAYGDIVARIAEYVETASENVMITNGSDQGIDLVIRSASTQGDEIIIPNPSFAFYQQCALIEDLIVRAPLYMPEEGFPLNAILDSICERTRVICIANPNNPSGTIASREAIETILKAAPHAAVLIDECYFEYSRVSVVDWVEQYKNLVVLRTFSKTWGMPSLRIGYIVSSKENIQALSCVRGPYDVNQLAVVAAKAALDNKSDMQSYVNEVMLKSKPSFEAFLTEQGISYWPSHANFVWVFPKNPMQMAKKLQDLGILVRPKSDKDGKLGLRITLGTYEQTQVLIAAVQSLIV